MIVPGGVFLAKCKWDHGDLLPVSIRTARKLKHAVVVTADSDGLVNFYALPIKGADK